MPFQYSPEPCMLSPADKWSNTEDSWAKALSEACIIDQTPSKDIVIMTVVIYTERISSLLQGHLIFKVSLSSRN